MPFGAELTAGGEVRFRLWAPAARQVELLLCDPRGAAVQAAPRVVGSTAGLVAIYYLLPWITPRAGRPSSSWSPGLSC